MPKNFNFARSKSPPSFLLIFPKLGSVTDSKIVIQKDTEKWEFARTPSTKVTGTLKVGEKVTVHYSMTATSIETKPAKAAEEKPAKKNAP